MIKEIDETNSDDPTKEGDQQENVDETVETVDANVDQDVEENEQPVEETDDQKDGEEKPLDNESEKLVQESLERLAKGRTTFTMAHRLTTIQNATEILVLTSEGIVERGTHEELLEKKGIYFNLYNR